MTHDVFISFASPDSVVANSLRAKLQTASISTWIFTEDQLPGDKINKGIIRAIKNSKLVVWIGSSRSIRRPKVIQELECADENGRKIVPVQIDDFDLPEELELILGPVIRLNAKVSEARSLDKALDKLVDAVRKHLNGLQSEKRERSDNPELTGKAILSANPNLKDEPGYENGVPVIGIVGAGFAGITTAIRLMQLASGPLKIKLFEQHQERCFGGLAYGAAGLQRDHYLNIHAGRISIFRERPDDFLKWANEDEKPSAFYKDLGAKNKREEKELDRKCAFNEFSGVPRLAYKHYLKARFEQSKKLAALSGVECKIINSEVVEVTPHDGPPPFATLKLKQRRKDKQLDPIEVAVAVLCTGHLKPLLPEPAKNLDLNDNKSRRMFFTDPFHPSFGKALKDHARIEPFNLLIIGSGQSAYDAAILAHEVSSKGKVTICSRGGLTHSPYPPHHSHVILPDVFRDLFEGKHSATAFKQAIDLAIQRAEKEMLPRFFPDVHAHVIPERVLKAIEDDVATFVSDTERVSDSEIRAFLSNRSWLTTRRTSVVREIYDKVRKAAPEYLEAEIVDFHQIDGKISVSFDPSAGAKAKGPFSRVFSHVVCCLGYDPDYSKAKGLWEWLLENQYAIPHRRTGFGIEVGNNGRIIYPAPTGHKENRLNEKSPRHLSLYAVGVMRQGDEIQRRGRLGAFTFSIGTIRNQALLAALSILRQVEAGITWRKAFNEVSHPRIYDPDELKAQLFRSNPAAKDGFDSIVEQLADTQFLSNNLARNGRLEQLRHELNGICERYLSGVSNPEYTKYWMWHTARVAAGKAVTDIRRLSERYALVRTYLQDFSTEKRRCKTILKQLLKRVGATGFTLSLFDGEYLHPFVSHMRNDFQSPTKIGEHVAGKLVDAFVNGSITDGNASNVEYLTTKEGEIWGCYVPDYNSAHPKKEPFKDKPRISSQIQLVLVTKGDSLVGVIYFDGAALPKFKLRGPACSKLPADLINEIASVIQKVASLWVSPPISDRQNQRLDGRDFTIPPNVSFRGLNFSQASLNRANLTGVDASSCNFSGASCQSALFDKAVLRGSTFVGTRINRYTTFQEADISGSTLYGVMFDQGVRLNQAKFAGSEIKRCSFMGAILDKAIFSGATLEDVDFSEASLSGAVLDQATLIRCNFTNVKCDQNTKFPEHLDEDTWRTLPKFAQDKCLRHQRQINKQDDDYKI